jgi:tetratricopeptide (TPR) repeat protein
MLLESVLCIGKICMSAASLVAVVKTGQPFEHLKELFEALSSGAEAVDKLLPAGVPALHEALQASQADIEKTYAKLLKNSHSSSFSETVDQAFANLGEVFETCVPRGQQLAKLNHDPELIGNFVADAAAARQIDAFRDGEGRKILVRLVVLAYTALDSKPEFMNALQRVNWKQAFEYLADIKRDTGEIKRDIGEIRESVDLLTRGLDLTQSARLQLEVDLAKVQTEYGGTVALVSGFLRTIVGRSIPQDQFAATLMELAASWQAAGRQIDALNTSRDLSPKLAELRDRLGKAYRDEQVETVEALLAEVAEVEQTALDRLISHRAEVGVEIELRRKGLAATKKTQASLAFTALRYDDAARLLVEVLALEIQEPETLRDAIRKEWQALYVYGCDKGSNATLEVSISLARLRLDRSVNVDQRGTAMFDLARSLQELGGRESETARLEQAVKTYRAALEERTRERVPLQWAATQDGLGNALAVLGERPKGAARLNEAVTAYRAALEERTRERVPLQWAATQNNLGTALSVLGERQKGTARLNEAVTAYRAALEERTRERAPRQWAATQNNLGNTLRVLGKRQKGVVKLKEAVNAYRATLEELPRERMPLKWAEAQNNLGNALATLGERGGAKTLLEEAVVAYRAALEELTRERTPWHFEQTQQNLSRVLRILHDRQSQ